MRFRDNRIGDRERRLRNSFGRLDASRLLRRGECSEQRHSSTGAEAEHGGRRARNDAFGVAIERGLTGEPLGAERDQIALVTETFARRRHRLDQFAIGGKDRRRPPEIREQPLCAVG